MTKLPPYCLLVILIQAGLVSLELLGSPAKESECKSKLAACVPGKQRAPVCGTDNHTYGNRCQLLRAQCEGVPVLVKHRGKCKKAQPCWADLSLSQRPGHRVRGSKSVFVPVCHMDGTYAPVQCHPESSFCWCVRPNGQSIPDTTVQNHKPDCSKYGKSGTRRRSQPRNLEGRRDCGRPDRTAFNTNLGKIFKTEFARSSVHQQRSAGGSAPDSDRAVLEWKFSAMDIDKDGFLDQDEYQELRRLVMKVVKPKRCARNFPVLCDLDADERISREEWAACLALDFNSLLQGSFAPLSGQMPSHRIEETVERREEPEVADCDTDRRVVLEEQKTGNSDLYVPECTLDGRYRQVQCYRSAGYCWCVHEDTGKPIPGTSVKDQDPKCDSIQSPSRPMNGCPEPRKQEFLKELLDFLMKKMVSSNKTDGANTTDQRLIDEHVAKWNFAQLDQNQNNVLERKEWKSLRSLVNSNRQLRRCGKRLPRYCDVNLDRKISLTEWLSCLSTQRNAANKPGRPISPPITRRRGHNPLEIYLNGDE